MSLGERFWWLLTMSAVIWYMTITVYVAFKGAIDIRSMLQGLEEQHRRNQEKSLPE